MTVLDPYDTFTPQSKAEAFTQLISEGMTPDKAFIALTIVAANGVPSVLDSENLTDIRGLIAVYAKETGQEALLWAKNW